MRTYVNEKTGAVICTPCEIHAEGWREETPAVQKPKKEAKRDERKLRDDQRPANPVAASD